VRKLLVLLVMFAALVVAPVAQAGTTVHYINCGTGAYLFYVTLTWNGYSWDVSTSRQPIWGSC
jgi:lipopolysaccharide export LptBFGC system permease protein LptF